MRFGFAADKMIVIGVTGTDGKTTTCTMIHSILTEAGIRAGMITTVEMRICDQSEKNTTHRTTLESYQLQKLLQKMVKEKCTHVVVETTSHALSQGRVSGISFDIGVITNFTPEHLDYHGTLKNYRQDKAILFKKLTHSKKKGIPKTSILNIDDKEFPFFSNIKTERTITYGRSLKADVQGMHEEIYSDHSTFGLVTHEARTPVKLAIPGSFNIDNALAAASVGTALGIKLEKIRRGLELVISVPGRMEKIDAGQNFNIYIDFAMTPNGYEKILSSLRKSTQGDIWLVFGCCGDRDKSKRPIIGEIAGNMADKIVLTDDEPYFEDPQLIRNMIEEGIRRTSKKKNASYFVIEGRRNGIEFAIKHAKTGDTVVIPGMGDFEGLTVRGKTLPWSDRRVILEILSSHGNK